MNPIKIIARKELRSYFLSPVALMFIGTFLFSSLFSFFWVEGFFSRNIADIRPLFEWFPILLIFLVPALGMRLWAEEERTGTMELLSTLPLSTRTLVLGKFCSGVLLITVALALTLPLPLTVQYLGNLDWGPVIGGYLATILLASSYLAITLCVSASTANQLVALVLSAAISGLLYLVGAETVTSFFGNTGAEILRNLGAGSRFESIQRGVVDLRDIVYYLSITTFCLYLNGHIINRKRWSDSPERRSMRLNAGAGVLLLAMNLVALNVVTNPMRGFRADLTQNQEYSISPVTQSLLGNLAEPLIIRGYFSQKTHPLLAPLVPRIRDLIEEYGTIDDHVRAEFIDPTSDPEIEKEAAQGYGIQSVPFQFADRHESSIVNSYFHILVKYGDQFETLDFNDLIEIQVNGMDIDVQLRNLEYDLTRAVQKVKYGFQSIESIFARLPHNAQVTAIVTPNTLPDNFASLPNSLEAVAKELTNRSKGRFEWKTLDPDVPNATLTREQLYQRYGIQPMAVSLFSKETFYLHLLVQVGDRVETLVPPESLAEADIRKELLAALRRAGPGSLKTIGMVTSTQDGGLPYARLTQALSQTYQVDSVSIKDGRIPGNIDILLLLDPKNTTEKEHYAIDQFIMRGGSVIIAAGSHVMDMKSREGLAVTQQETGLAPLLESYGIKVGSEVVLDSQNAAFPIPVTRNIGGFTVRDVQMLKYPAFVDIRRNGIDLDNPALASLPGLVLHWASTVDYEPTEAEGTKSDIDTNRSSILLHSSPDSWTAKEYRAQPNFASYPNLGWSKDDETKTNSLAVSLVGPFKSYFASAEAPVLGENQAEGEDDNKNQGRRGNVLEASPERSRLVVIGSASFLSDPVASITRSVSESSLKGFQLIHNLADWCLEDIELLKIRSRGNYARVLNPTPLATRKAIEWGNYALAFLAVLAIGLASLNRRRRTQAIPLNWNNPTEAANGQSTTNSSQRKDEAA